MQANEHKDHKDTTRRGLPVKNSPPTVDNAHTPTLPAGYSPVIHQHIHTGDNVRRVWQDLGRDACAKGRPFSASPYGAQGLTVEGVLRAQAWCKGWQAEQVRRIQRGEKGKT